MLYKLVGNDNVLHIVNEHDAVARADRPYIHSLIELYSTTLEARNQVTPPTWSLPEAELEHFGEVVILKTNLASSDSEEDINSQREPIISARSITPTDLLRLLFCRLSVHARTEYQDRMEQLERGFFNERRGWSPGTQAT